MKCTPPNPCCANAFGFTGNLHGGAIAGYPIMSVPIGFVHGLPVGLAITGPANSEALLLRVARALEARLGLLDDGGLVPPL